MISLFIMNAEGTFDITNMASQITCSGNYQQCSRTLEFGLLSNFNDKSIPVIKSELGSKVVLKEGNDILFNGFVFRREKATGSSLISITCFDRGIYLKRNKASYNANGITPDVLTKRICNDFKIQIGIIENVNIKIKRKFLGCSLYEIIVTMYTLASQQNKKKYAVFFKDDKLFVQEKKKNDNTIVIDGSSNLMQATTSESIEAMINQVVICNKQDKLIKTMKNEEAIRLYGIMQEYLKQSDKQDISDKAQKMLDDNGVEQKITIENLGNSVCITGGTVIVREPYTGVYGLFYIESDVHTWKRGQYYNKLVINFKVIVDEKEVGEALK